MPLRFSLSAREIFITARRSTEPLGPLTFRAPCQVPVMFWASSALPGKAERANIDNSNVCPRQLFMRQLLYRHCISSGLVKALPAGPSLSRYGIQIRRALGESNEPLRECREAGQY